MFLAWTQWIALLLVLLLAGASVALTALTDAGGETSVTDRLVSCAAAGCDRLLLHALTRCEYWHWHCEREEEVVVSTGDRPVAVVRP
jgi:hypothetical protein